LVGGLINKWLDNRFDEWLGSVVPETPPPQEVMEVLRDTPIREEDNREANWETNLLVHAGMVLPAYEDTRLYKE